ncbi:MAG: PCMD domain-containing protein [Muribaculaceae bacterium]|nr:PCMD domain-containing protein [Muribaculaceae bacterium]
MNLICKIKVCALWIAACSLSLTSCFKDEPLNTECDITQVTLHVNEPAQFFFQLTDSVKNVLYTDSTIVISVRSHADVSHLAPQFVITEGATITPAAGEPQDFTHGPVTYTVTSQDGQWHRTYRMSVVPTTIIVNDTLKIDFEHFDLEPSYNSYYVWFQQLADGSLSADWWTSGNAGFKFSMGSAKPDEYPTCVLANGYDGYGLQLITRDTGPFGRMASKPIAAGNFFIGEFDAVNAVSHPMESTRFGRPFAQKPIRFTGYYQYKPGSTVINKKGQVQEGVVDQGSIYAVLYRNHDAAGNALVLYGDNVLTSENIVAIAQVSQVNLTTTWTPWDIQFTYLQQLDQQLLENYGYSLTIVFSSSKEGAVFEGAVGSTLLIDEVRLITESTE